MIAVTMPQAAESFGLKPEYICFAARLGKLPDPVGHNAAGLLLFDARQLADRLGIAQPGAQQ